MVLPEWWVLKSPIRNSDPATLGHLADSAARRMSFTQIGGLASFRSNDRFRIRSGEDGNKEFYLPLILSWTPE